MSLVSTRVVGPLTPRDIYESSPKTLVVSAPADLQLDWYFENFDKIMRLKKPPKDKHGKGYTTHAGLLDKNVSSVYSVKNFKSYRSWRILVPLCPMIRIRGSPYIAFAGCDFVFTISIAVDPLSDLIS
jgi:hypothetical protein